MFFLKTPKTIITLNNDYLYPKNAKKDVAASLMLSKYPNGLEWQEVADKVNESGLCHTKLSLERPDYVLHSSQNIFQIDTLNY